MQLIVIIDSPAEILFDAIAIGRILSVVTINPKTLTKRLHFSKIFRCTGILRPHALSNVTRCQIAKTKAPAPGTKETGRHEPPWTR